MEEIMGSITASCGHVLGPDEEDVMVFYKDEDCDAVEGFHPVLISASFCQKCAAEWKADGVLFDTMEEGMAWLDSLPIE
jgi:hypothetical protein